VPEPKSGEFIEWSCPFCGQISRVQLTAGIRPKCQHCGKDWHTPGVEVEDKQTRKFLKEAEKLRKREVDADKERE
jgi:ribosomal protein L37AE/L43A